MHEIQAEQYINLVARNGLPHALTLGEVAAATKEDSELQELVKWIERCDGPLPKRLIAYKQFIHEMNTTSEGILLRGQLIVIPSSLRERVVKLAHAGHQGIVKTKSLIRSRVWYPGIDTHVEREVRTCRECQANTDKQRFEPLMPSKLPAGPWQKVDGDFFGPMRDGTYWFVNYCEYSRWVAVNSISTTSMAAVQRVLDELFGVFGAPSVYKTDNGSPFQSNEFAEYAKQQGFEHRRVTPLWPRANGEVETAVFDQLFS
jgi:hypothetical protein